MSRYGVLLLFFDFPSTTKEDRRDYARFRKMILKKGFCQLQESVYIKLLHNISQHLSECADIQASSPEDASVFVLPMSLNEFKRIKFLHGNEFDISFFSDDIVYV